MPDELLFEQFHISILVPRDLSPRECGAVRRALAGKTFRARLLNTVRALLGRYPSLRKTCPDVSV